MVLPAGLSRPESDASSPPAGPGWASPKGWIRRLGEAPPRSRRIGILLVAVLLISLADLDMTLAYASSGGMLEANPIARAVMSYGSSKVLAAWKLLSLLLCTWILFRARGKVLTEVATWVCFGALVWLSFRWESYNEQAPMMSTTVLVTAEMEEGPVPIHR